MVIQKSEDNRIFKNYIFILHAEACFVHYFTYNARYKLIILITNQLNMNYMKPFLFNFDVIQFRIVFFFFVYFVFDPRIYQLPRNIMFLCQKTRQGQK